MSNFSVIRKINTSERDDWIVYALDCLFDGYDVLIVDPATGRQCLVYARWVRVNKPAWGIVWRELRADGIRAPRRPK